MSDEMIKCKNCKYWDPKAKEITLFFEQPNSSFRHQNHPAGIGLCARDYPPKRPAEADEAFGWNVEADLPSDIFTGPEHGCTRGEQ